MNCPLCGHPLDAMPPTCPGCGQALEYRSASDPGEVPESPWAPPRDWLENGGADEPATPFPDGTEFTTALPDGPAPTAGLPDTHDPAAGLPDVAQPATELPANGFGNPGQYLAATHRPPIRQYMPMSPVSPDGTPWSPVRTQPKRHLLALPILLLTLALLVGGGGTAAAGYYLGWFGQGVQPSDLMPASTIAYAQIDLDPSLSQKSQAWAFLRDLPQVRKAVAAGQPDPKKLIWDALSADEDIMSGADYDSDIKPWLGDRVGFGVLAHGDELAWMTIIQVTDEALAADKLRSWVASDHQDFDVATRDGYAVVTAHADTDFVSGELEKGSLSSDETFRSDVTALGDTGVFAAWADLGALAKQGAFSDSKSATVQGRMAVALRFTVDTLALDGRFFAAGRAARGVSGAGMIGTLPQATGFAITISGGAEAFKGIRSALPGGFDPLAGSGLDAADLEALLGRNLTIAAPTSTLAAHAGVSASEPLSVGVRITTDDVAGARSALRKLARADGAAPPVFDDVDGDVLTAATTQHYLSELLHPTAELSGNGAFTRAVPDHAKAVAAAYVNLVPLVTARDDLGEYGDFVASLQGIGTEIVPDGDGGGSWSVRLVRS